MNTPTAQYHVFALTCTPTDTALYLPFDSADIGIHAESEFMQLAVVPIDNIQIHPRLYYWHFAGGWTFEFDQIIAQPAIDTINDPKDALGYAIRRLFLEIQRVMPTNCYYERYFYRNAPVYNSSPDPTDVMRLNVMDVIHTHVAAQVGDEYYPEYLEWQPWNKL